MKAITVEEFGEADVLRYVDADRPDPGEGEVLIEVRSAGVNYADTMRRRNQAMPFPSAPWACISPVNRISRQPRSSKPGSAQP